MLSLMSLLLIALGFEDDGFWIFGIIGLIQAIAHIEDLTTFIEIDII